MQEVDLLVYYKAIMRTVLEYPCLVWHPGLTKAQSDLIESTQKRLGPCISYYHHSATGKP